MVHISENFSTALKAQLRKFKYIIGSALKLVNIKVRKLLIIRKNKKLWSKLYNSGSDNLNLFIFKRLSKTAKKAKVWILDLNAFVKN